MCLISTIVIRLPQNNINIDDMFYTIDDANDEIVVNNAFVEKYENIRE